MPSRTPPTASAARPNLSSDSPSKSPQQHTAEKTSGSALPVSRYVTFFTLAAVGCLIDLATKHVVFAWRGLPPRWRGEIPQSREIHWLLEGFFGIETALNEGALFGMGQGKVWLFALLSFVAIGGIIYWLFAAKAARDAFLTVALGIIMGGILGNLYDRLGLWNGTGPDGQTIYAVRDWILISYGGLEFPKLGKDWPNFNIADSLLVCGAGMLIWHSFAKSGDRSGTKTDTAQEKQSKN